MQLTLKGGLMWLDQRVNTDFGKLKFKLRTLEQQSTILDNHFVITILKNPPSSLLVGVQPL